MGMGNYAQYADVVEEDFVKKYATDEYNNLILYLEDNCSDIDELAICQLSEEYPDCVDEEECEKLWNALQNKFEKETGLGLFLNYHNSECRGDEVDGYFFCVGGVYCYTEAGRKYQEEIERKHWVITG